MSLVAGNEGAALKGAALSDVRVRQSRATSPAPPRSLLRRMARARASSHLPARLATRGARPRLAASATSVKAAREGPEAIASPARSARRTVRLSRGTPVKHSGAAPVLHRTRWLASRARLAPELQRGSRAGEPLRPSGKRAACGGQSRLGVAAPHLEDSPVLKLLTPRPLTPAARPMAKAPAGGTGLPDNATKSSLASLAITAGSGGEATVAGTIPDRAHRLHPLRVLVRAHPLVWDHLYSWYWLTSTSSRTPSASWVRTAIEQYSEIR